jgi:hypothetical protein
MAGVHQSDGWLLVAYIASGLFSGLISAIRDVFTSGKLHDPTTHAQALQQMLLLGGIACAAVVIVLVLALNVIPHPSWSLSPDMQAKIFGAGTILWGMDLLWHTHRNRKTWGEKYRGAPLYPRYVKMRTTLEAAGGICVIGGGLALVTATSLYAAISIAMMIVCGASIVVMAVAGLGTAVTASRLESDWQIEQWKQRHCSQ